MATRFLAMVPNGIEPIGNLLDEIEYRAGLTKILVTPRLTILVDDAADYMRLPGHGGAIIGNLFSREDRPKRIRSVSDDLARQIVRSGGTHLIDTCWGGYVSIIQSDGDGQTHIVRDPSGAMPCYYLETAHATIISSDVETLLASGLLLPAIDWQYMLYHLLAYDLRSQRTGLTGVSELLAGFRLSLSGANQKVTQCWSPWDHVSAEHQRENHEIADSLHETVTRTVQAWASCYDHILLGISGGLDSSIIAACLKGHTTRLTCLTMATDEAEGDERRYARIVTDALKLPLIEGFHDLARTDITRSTAAHLPRPLLYAFGQSEHETKFALAREHRIDAFFSGIGGDNVFCHMVSPSPVIDRFRVQGFGNGTLTTIDDVCRLTGCSLWQLARHGLPRLFARNQAYRWERNMQFVSQAAASGLDFPLTHPWLNAPDGALPGKAAHIAMLLRIQGTIDGFSRLNTGPQINPLLSQPIVEACLRIPTWAWCSGGENRSVARRAFQNDLPDAIIHRRSKGGPDTFAFEVIETNRSILRERLLSGVLAQHGLLDLVELEKCFDDRRPVQKSDYVRLSALAEAEAWARHWLTYSGTDGLKAAAA
jgi:asparagine synthase (glutamine-hydrolysing)